MLFGIEGVEQLFVCRMLYSLCSTSRTPSAYLSVVISVFGFVGGFRQLNDETDYEWVREYSYQVHQEEGDERRTYVFRFEPDKVAYTHISAKLTLSKRGKHTKGEHQAQDFSRPSKVNHTHL